MICFLCSVAIPPRKNTHGHQQQEKNVSNRATCLTNVSLTMSTSANSGSLGLTFNVKDYGTHSTIPLETSSSTEMLMNEQQQSGAHTEDDGSCSSLESNNDNHRMDLYSDDGNDDNVATGKVLNEDGEEEDWDELLPLPEPVIPGNIEVEMEHGMDEFDNNGGNNDDGNDENVSLSPPPSLPLVIVDLVKLCGHAPRDSKEAEFMKDQVRSALFRDDDDDNHATTSEQEDEHNNKDGPLSRHFDNRCQELFETGVAFHGQTTDTAYYENNNGNNEYCYAVIPYPEYFCRMDQQKVLVTERQWKMLLKPHSIPVVDRLLTHLSCCSRSLSWKIDMNTELRQLAKYEERERIKRQRQVDLQRWKTERRRAQLDKLYTVRETFDEKLETAQSKLDEFENEREEALNKNFKGLGLASTSGGGEWQRNKDDNADFESATYDIFSQEEEDEAPFTEELKEGRGGETVKDGKTIKDEHRVMQAVVESIEKRLKQIDDLLESLQEEEWADEEEGLIDENENNATATEHESSSTTTELTLLDQILAMILGELPSHNKRNNMESHYKYIRSEHKAIVEEWKEHFGRLPVSLGGGENGKNDNAETSAPQSSRDAATRYDNEGDDENIDLFGSMAAMTSPFTTSDMDTAVIQQQQPGIHQSGGGVSTNTTPSIDEMRHKVGIVENDVTDDWDDVEDWDAILPPIKSDNPDASNNENNGNTSAPRSNSTVGLRPGGGVGLRPGGKIA